MNSKIKELKMAQTKLIIEVGELIRMYDKDLADMWDHAPFSFQRVDMARAFASALCKDENEDPSKLALFVVRAAYHLREMRTLENEMMEAA